MGVVIGIDPGVQGAVAVVDAHGRVVALEDTPTFWITANRHRRRAYNTAAMRAMLSRFIDGDNAPHVIVEAQHPMRRMRKQGVTSMFSTGFGFGLWIGLLVGLGIRHTVVEPQVWQRSMLLGRGDTKARALLASSRLFPTLAIPKTRHGRADALLLAEYGRRYLLVGVEAAS